LYILTEVGILSDIITAVEALNKKGFKAVYAKDASGAVDYVLSQVAQDQTVGAGGSVTLAEAGIIDALVKRGNTVYSSSVAQKKGQDTTAARKSGMTADVYVSSTNAVTLEGDLVNIDGIGNRAAAMFYGPDKVIIVAGRNKITTNPHTAIARIKKDACPKNARRLGLDTPCAMRKCEDCSSPQRMCNVVVRIQYPTAEKEMHVVLIDGDFGY
jgi:L-lactate utilization protein LutB